MGSFPFEADDEVFSSPLLLSTLIYITPLLELLSRSTIYFETNAMAMHGNLKFPFSRISLEQN